jgi:histidinol-phosphate/aromatic aminotransferase/cobyric acid decarboxylase-like protein
MSESIEVQRVPPPGDHGDDAERVAHALGVEPAAVLDLAQTLNPVAPDITRLAIAQLDSLRRYPDVTRATSSLAEALGVESERLLLTNGGAEAIALVAAERVRGWVEEPDFSLYREHLPELDPTAGHWRSNPHSPTGDLAPPTRRAEVWDEAFWPITTGTWTRGDADDGAIVVGSLTKLYACPGLRMGYVIGPDASLTARIRARQPKWSVNNLAVSLLPSLIEQTDLASWSSEVLRLRASLVRELRRRHLPVSFGDAPWVLVRRPHLRPDLAEHGVLVRDCTSFGLVDTARVATPSAADLPRLLDALDRVLDQGDGHG